MNTLHYTHTHTTFATHIHTHTSSGRLFPIYICMHTCNIHECYILSLLPTRESLSRAEVITYGK